MLVEVTFVRDARSITQLAPETPIEPDNLIAGAFIRNPRAAFAENIIAGVGGGGVSAFIQLTDVPSTYAGAAGKAVSVNATATGLEFTDPAVDDHVAIALQTDTIIPIDDAVDPTNGQVLTYDHTANKWKPVTPIGGIVSLVRGFSFGADKTAGIATGRLKHVFKCPYAGTISGWWIAIGLTDSGTVTVKFLKAAGALPVIGDSINTAGVSLTTGNYVSSVTLTDFISTAVAAGSVFAVQVTAVTGTITDLTGGLEITV